MWCRKKAIWLLVCFSLLFMVLLDYRLCRRNYFMKFVQFSFSDSHIKLIRTVSYSTLLGLEKNNCNQKNHRRKVIATTVSSAKKFTLLSCTWKINNYAIVSLFSFIWSSSYSVLHVHMTNCVSIPTFFYITFYTPILRECIFKLQRIHGNFTLSFVSRQTLNFHFYY